MLGRLASIVAKELLSGQHIVRTAERCCLRTRAACGGDAQHML